MPNANFETLIRATCYACPASFGFYVPLTAVLTGNECSFTVTTKTIHEEMTKLQYKYGYVPPLSESRWFCGEECGWKVPT